MKTVSLILASLILVSQAHAACKTDQLNITSPAQYMSIFSDTFPSPSVQVGRSFTITGSASFTSSDLTLTPLISVAVDGSPAENFNCPAPNLNCYYSIPTSVSAGTHTVTVTASCGGSSITAPFEAVVASSTSGYDIASSDNPAENPNIPCRDCEAQSTVNVINGVVRFPIELFSTGSSPLSTSFSLFYDSQDIDGTDLQGVDLPYRQPLGRGWDHSYNLSLYKNSDGTMVVRGGGAANRFYTPNPDGSYTSRAGDFSTFAKTAGGTYQLNQRSGMRYSFADTGVLTSIQDRFGNKVSVADHRHDTIKANTITITDPAQRVTTLALDDSGLVNAIIDPAGNRYGIISIFGQVYAITFPDGDSWSFEYNEQGALSLKADPDGNEVTYGYDDNGRGTTFLVNGVQSHTVSYWQDSSGFTGGTGGQTSFTHANNLITGVTDPAGIKVNYAYNGKGLLGSETYPVDGQTVYVWDYQYDSYGNRTDVLGHPRRSGVDLPADYHMGYTYDNANYDRVKSVINYLDSPATTTDYSYDTDAGYQRVSITGPIGGSTVMRLESSGALHDVVSADSRQSVYAYDAKEQLSSVTSAGVKTAYSNYTGLGYPGTVELFDNNNALIQTRFYQYDGRGRVTRETASGAVPYVTSYGYDANGNRNAVADANGNKTTYQFDNKGRLTRTTDALNKSTQMEYVGEGKLSAVTDAIGSRTSYSYDTSERLLREVPAAGDPIRYEYDTASGRLWRKKNDRTAAVLVIFSYDSLGRPVRKDFADGTWASYSYTSGGRLQTAANQDSSLVFGYYPSGLVQSVSDAAGRTVSYSYDTAGRRTAMAVNGGHSTSYGYTAEKLTSITSSLAGAFGYDYDALGRRRSVSYPNGITGTYSYHAEQPSWLSGISYSGVSPAYSVSYPTVDQVGNRTSKNDGGGVVNLAYSSVYRLLAAGAEAYDYDAVGNRLAGPQASNGYSYGTDNRLLTGPRVSNAYDEYGNRKSSGTWSYTWDLENRLVKATRAGVSVSFKYDALGRRIGKTFEIFKFKRSTYYLYDEQNIVAEYVNGKLGNQYLPGDDTDEHLAVIEGAANYFYIADGLGSVSRITDSNKNVVQSYRLDTFGKIVSATGSVEQPYLFTGREFDRETGLYYYRARYYDPEVGRFISRDPIGLNGGVNLYLYAESNPVNNTDPYGYLSFGSLKDSFLNAYDIVKPIYDKYKPVYDKVKLGHGIYKSTKKCSKKEEYEQAKSTVSTLTSLMGGNPMASGAETAVNKAIDIKKQENDYICYMWCHDIGRAAAMGNGCDCQ